MGPFAEFAATVQECQDARTFPPGSNNAIAGLFTLRSPAKSTDRRAYAQTKGT